MGIYSFEEIIGHQIYAKNLSKILIARKNMSFSIITTVWLGEHQMFIVDRFKIESYSVVQSKFCKKILIRKHDSVLSHVTISTWVKIFQETRAAISVGAIGRKRSVQTVKNWEKLQEIVEVAQWFHFVNTLFCYVSRSVQHIEC